MGGGLGGPGILTTAGDLLFSGDFDGNLIAFNATNGDICGISPCGARSVMDLRPICWMGANI